MIYEIDAATLAVKRKLSLGAEVVSMRMAPAGGSLLAAMPVAALSGPG